MIARILDGLVEILFGIIDLLIWFVPIIFSFMLFSVMMLVMWVPVALFQGYSIVMLWQWFIMPLGFSALNIKTAIGASLIINLLTSHLNEMKSKDDLLNHMFYWITGQVLILAAGYIVKTMFI
jgi:hypothetical protein